MCNGKAADKLSDVQKNIDKIQSNLTELEARLKHEQAKFKNYNVDMQEAETRCVCQLLFHLCAVSWTPKYVVHQSVTVYQGSVWQCHTSLVRWNENHVTIFLH